MPWALPCSPQKPLRFWKYPVAEQIYVRENVLSSNLSAGRLLQVGPSSPRGRCSSLFGGFEMHLQNPFELKLTAMIHFREMVPVPPNVLTILPAFLLGVPGCSCEHVGRQGTLSPKS